MEYVEFRGLSENFKDLTFPKKNVPNFDYLEKNRFSTKFLFKTKNFSPKFILLLKVCC